VSDPGRILAGILAGLAAISPLEAVSVALALVSALQEVRRSRWCWVTGGLSAAIAIYLNARARLPMQAALQVYFVVISVYGFWHWSKDQGEATRSVTVWPWWKNLIACLATVAVSATTARWLAIESQAAWPFLDSLTTWGSLLATWLTARVKLECWLYWLAIDSTLAFLFAAQGLYLFALLSIVYLGVSAVGFAGWLKTYRHPVPASQPEAG
jgi:nicotinamide mononucleotide transporter